MGKVERMVKEELSATMSDPQVLVSKLQKKIEETEGKNPRAVEKLNQVIEIVVAFGGTNMDEALRAAEEADEMLDSNEPLGLLGQGSDEKDDVPEAKPDPPPISIAAHAKPSKPRAEVLGGNAPNQRPPPPIQAPGISPPLIGAPKLQHQEVAAPAVVEVEETPKSAIPATKAVSSGWFREDITLSRARRAMIAWPIRLMKSRWTGWVVAGIMLVIALALGLTLQTALKADRNNWIEHYNKFHPGTHPFNH